MVFAAFLDAEGLAGLCVFWSVVVLEAGFKLVAVFGEEADTIYFLAGPGAIFVPGFVAGELVAVALWLCGCAGGTL